MHHSLPSLLKVGLAMATLLPSGLTSCTYDFDRFGRVAAGAAGSGGSDGSGGSGLVSRGGTSGEDPTATSGGTGGAGTGGAGTGGAGTGGLASGGLSDTGPTSSGGADPLPPQGGAAGKPSDGATGGADGTSGGATSPPMASECTKVGGTLWNQHCYFVIDGASGQSWQGAEAACAETAGHLVAINTADEQAMLETTFIDASRDYWIGLSLQDAASPDRGACQRLPSSCPFRWLSGEEFSYSNWDNLEPNYGGACARIKRSTGKWADISCTTPLFGICERTE